jgi:hypothetical protein
MRNKTAGSLEINSQGGRHVIFVPPTSADALRTFLQSKGVTATHPHTVTDDTSSVEISSRYDLVKVQAMLDDWKSPASPKRK